MSYSYTPGASGPQFWGRKLWVTNPQSIYYGLEVEATGGHARTGWVMVEGMWNGQHFRCEVMRGHLSTVPPGSEAVNG